MKFSERKSWWAPPRADRYAVKEFCAPVITRWFHTWTGKLYCIATGEIVEEWCFSIKLPIWGMYYAISNDSMRFGQLTFQFRGIRGCFVAAVFPVEKSMVDTHG